MKAYFFIFLFIGGLTALVRSADDNNTEAPYDVSSTSESTATTLLGSPTMTTESIISSTETIFSSTKTVITPTGTIISSTGTTATAVSPTTAPYKPDDKGETNVFNVTDSKGKVCILFKGLMKFNFAYKKADDPTKNSTGSFFLPSEAKGTKVSGSCDESSTHQTMNLTFFNDWTLSLSFVKNSSTNNYHLEHFELHYKIQNGSLPFPDAQTMGSKVATLKVTEEAVPELASYVCLTQKILEPEKMEESGLQTMILSNEQYEAFVSIDEVFFSTIRVRCKEDKISNLVPIAVGVALAVLIVIVIVAYLIGRHRSRRGYESV